MQQDQNNRVYIPLLIRDHRAFIELSLPFYDRNTTYLREDSLGPLTSFSQPCCRDTRTLPHGLITCGLNLLS